MINWIDALNGVDQALEYFVSQGVKPTLRTLFYNLYSRALVPNTKSAYQHLSRRLVKARKEGRYSWDFMEDRTRMVYGELQDDRFSDDVADDFERILVAALDRFDAESILKEYFDYLKPEVYAERWADQKEICEVWIEKEALASTLQNWVSCLGVPVKVNKGYSSWTFIFNNAEALKETLKSHEKVTALLSEYKDKARDRLRSLRS